MVRQNLPRDGDHDSESIVIQFAV